MKKKILSYSRFTPAQPPDRVADYDCCLPAIIAAKELLLPDWEIHIACDPAGYAGFWKWRDFVVLGIPAVAMQLPPSLIQGMLWRLYPVLPSYKDTEVVAFRDLDSVLLPSETTALVEFRATGAVVHGICASVEHGLPFMGGLTAVNVDRLRSFHREAADKLANDAWAAIYSGTGDDYWHRRGYDQLLYAKHFEPFVGRHDLIHDIGMSLVLRKRLARMNAQVRPLPPVEDTYERRLAGHCGAVVSSENARALYALYVERLRQEGKRHVAASLVAIQST